MTFSIFMDTLKMTESLGGDEFPTLRSESIRRRFGACYVLCITSPDAAS